MISELSLKEYNQYNLSYHSEDKDHLIGNRSIEETDEISISQIEFFS